MRTQLFLRIFAPATNLSCLANNMPLTIPYFKAAKQGEPETILSHVRYPNRLPNRIFDLGQGATSNSESLLPTRRRCFQRLISMEQISSSLPCSHYQKLNYVGNPDENIGRTPNYIDKERHGPLREQMHPIIFKATTPGNASCKPNRYEVLILGKAYP